jgi:hypothetical protein
MFIIHYGDKKNNYKEWVDVYIKYKDKLKPIIDNYLKTKNKKILKKVWKNYLKMLFCLRLIFCVLSWCNYFIFWLRLWKIKFSFLKIYNCFWYSWYFAIFVNIGFFYR